MLQPKASTIIKAPYRLRNFTFGKSKSKTKTLTEQCAATVKQYTTSQWHDLIMLAIL